MAPPVIVAAASLRASTVEPLRPERFLDPVVGHFDGKAPIKSRTTAAAGPEDSVCVDEMVAVFWGCLWERGRLRENAEMVVGGRLVSAN